MVRYLLWLKCTDRKIFSWHLPKIILTTREKQSSEEKRLGMLDFPDEHEPRPPCDSVEGHYKKAAVVTNTEFCSAIGRDILRDGGSAVDAAIASLLCEGLCGMQNMGCGGGCFMTIYSRQPRKVFCLDARETAPRKAHKDMYQGRYEKSASGLTNKYDGASVDLRPIVSCGDVHVVERHLPEHLPTSQPGGLSIAVPGELMGYWEAHKKFGKLPWSQLFQPAINMCLKGIPVNRRLGKSFSDSGMGPEIMSSPSLRKLLAPSGRLPTIGDTLRLPSLAKTLTVIANSPRGALELYEGSMSDAFVSDIQRMGGIITLEDLSRYKAQWKEPVAVELSNGLLLYSCPPPASGVILAVILRLLDDGMMYRDPSSRPKNAALITEAFKYAYALRSQLGDPNYTDLRPILKMISSDEFINETRMKMRNHKTTENSAEAYGALFNPPSDHGTINIVVLAPNGDAVCATSTINTLFGSLLASESTGIILNNEMDDFCSPRIINSFNIPPSVPNFIEGGKRPMSSSCPSVIVDRRDDNIRLVVGAAGGTHITTSTAQVIMNNLWFGLSIKEAVDMPRIHHQLYPMCLRYEDGISTAVVKHVTECGHKVRRGRPSSSVTAITQTGGVVTASYDYRRGGSTAGY